MGGTCSADGNGEVDLASTQIWLNFMKDNYISDANWAISDKDEKCAALRPGSDADGSWPVGHLTTSGAFVRSSIRTFQQVPDASSTSTTTVASGESTKSPGSSTTRLRSTSRAEPKTSTT